MIYLSVLHTYRINTYDHNTIFIATFIHYMKVALRRLVAKISYWKVIRYVQPRACAHTIKNKTTNIFYTVFQHKNSDCGWPLTTLAIKISSRFTIQLTEMHIVLFNRKHQHRVQYTKQAILWPSIASTSTSVISIQHSQCGWTSFTYYSGTPV